MDPSKQKTGGGLLGDRIRMNSLSRNNVFMRSMASRGSGREISDALPRVLSALQNYDFDLVIAETSGIGQGSSAILDVADTSLYVMTSEFGAQSQLEKIDMIDLADLISINKADRRGAEDAHRDVTKQYRRSHKLFHDKREVPVYLTQASNFNDKGVNELFVGLCSALFEKSGEKKWALSERQVSEMRGTEKQTIVPPERQNYLAEIVSTVRDYKKSVKEKTKKASELGALEVASGLLGADSQTEIQKKSKDLKSLFDDEEIKSLETFEDLKRQYEGEELSYSVRGKEIKVPLRHESLSGLQIPRVCLPQSDSWAIATNF